jgi:uncharacterized protein with PIN domain
MFLIELNFRGNLPDFLSRRLRGAGPVQRLLKEKTAVKDVIEACGIPHVMVDLIVVSDSRGGTQSVDFAWPIEAPVTIEVHPVPTPPDVLPGAPRLQRRLCDRFVADGHLGKLARRLRLLGLDTAYEHEADDSRLLEIMASEDRALLTRDRRLLMHSIVRDGYCPHSSDAYAQTREVLHRYSLDPERLARWTRCLCCNRPLESVEKSEVAGRLAGEPLTLRYFDEFRRCTGCERIYWQGSHVEKLEAMLRQLGQD